jgi:hypothetical protein
LAERKKTPQILKKQISGGRLLESVKGPGGYQEVLKIHNPGSHEPQRPGFVWHPTNGSPKREETGSLSILS